MRVDWRHYFWTTGEPWNSIRSWLVPRILRALHCSLMCTLRVTVSGVERAQPHLREDAPVGCLFVTWHDLTLMPLHVFRNMGIGIMTSRSRSGQIQAAFWRLYGWPTVWGSTKKREGIKALREVLHLLGEGRSFAFTPDGPKGPRHYAHPGVVYMASHASCVLMPLGIAASSAWRLPTWDRYLIPKPFSRAHVYLGEEMYIPAELSREEMEEWRCRVEAELNRAQVIAQQELAKRASG
jgi:hypothetical protein